MSRIGKRPIIIPAGVKVEQRDRTIFVQGPKGANSMALPQLVEVKVTHEQMTVEADFLNNRHAKAQMGTTQSVLSGMVTGVTQGFTKKLVLNGVGYKAAVVGNKLEMNLGYSHPVNYVLPTGVKAAVEANTQITLSSHDKVLLGQTAAKVRSFREPEPFQGKGVAYADEKIRRKAGKTGKK